MRILPDVSRLIGQMGRAPGLTPSQLSEMLRLARDRDEAKKGSDEALRRLEGLGAEARGVSEQVQTELSDTPSYKRPERKGPSKGSVNFGLALGALGALANVDNPEDLTGTVIGGAKQRSDETYSDEMDTLRERMALDRQAKLDRVAGLQAKIGGIGTDISLTGAKQTALSGQASDIGRELFNREEAAKADFRESERTRQWWTSFNWTKDQAKQAQDNWQKEFDLRSEPLADKLARDEAGFVSRGVDPKTARLWAYGSVMANAAQAEMLTTELARKKAVFALISPEKEAQQELWRMDFEVRQGNKQMKLLDAQIAATGRSNRPAQGQTLEQMKLGLAVGNIDRVQALIDAAEKDLTGNAAKYGNPEHVNDAKKVREAISRYKLDLVGYMKQANAIQPGLYDPSALEGEMAKSLKWLTDPIGAATGGR